MLPLTSGLISSEISSGNSCNEAKGSAVGKSATVALLPLVVDSADAVAVVVVLVVLVAVVVVAVVEEEEEEEKEVVAVAVVAVETAILAVEVTGCSTWLRLRWTVLLANEPDAACETASGSASEIERPRAAPLDEDGE